MAPFDFRRWLNPPGRTGSPRKSRPVHRCHLEPLEDRVVPAVQYTPGPLLAPAVNRTDVGLGDNSGANFQEPYAAVNPRDPGNVILTSHSGLRGSVSSGGPAANYFGMTFPNPPGSSSDGDTSTAFDAMGRLFWANLTDLNTGGGDDVLVTRIDPATGQAVGSAVDVNVVSGDPTNAGVDDDKEMIEADANPNSPFANNLYLVWTKFDSNNGTIRFSRSTDGGQTWSLPLVLNAPGDGFVWPADVGVGPNGDVYVAYHSQPTFDANGAPDGTSGQIIVRRSIDGGMTFGPTFQAFTGGQADLTFNVQTDGRLVPHTPVWTEGSAQPWVLPDPARAGNVYVVTADDPTNGAGGADVADVVFARSTDNGVTWTRSTIPTGGTNELFPTASVDAFGNIVVAWYDDRRGLLNANGHTEFDVFATYSTDGGLTWAPAFQVNDPASPLNTDYPGAQRRFPTPQNAYDPTNPNETSRIGEYFGIDVFGGTAYVTWNGNTGTAAAPTGHQLITDAFPLNGSLTVTGDDAGVTADVFTLRQIANNPGFIEVLVNGQRQYAGLLAGVGLGVTFNGLGGGDTLVIDSSNGDPIPAGGVRFDGGGAELDTLRFLTTGTNGWIITGPNSGSTDGGLVTFSNVDNLEGGSAADSFTFQTGGSLAGGIDGGGGDNTIVGDDGGRTFTLLGANSGAISTLLGGTFSNVQNLTGGGGADSFVFQPGGGAGTLDGAGGTDTLDYSGFLQAILTNLQTGTSTGLAGTFAGIESLVGSASPFDILFGQDNLNTWTVTGVNKGDVDGFLFDGIENLGGGSQADAFVFAVAGAIDGDLDGGAGRDVMDFSASLPQAVRLSSLGGTDGFNGFPEAFVPLGGFFFDMDAVLGSLAFGDSLLGRPAGGVWDIDGVNAGHYLDGGRTFDFIGFEFLTGRTGDDTFVLHAGSRVAGLIDGGSGIGDVLQALGAPANDTMVLTPGRLTFEGLPTLFSDVEAVKLLGQGGNDQFTLRFDQGNPVPPRGVSVNGGAGVDVLTTVGSALKDAMVLTPGFLRVNAAAPVSYLGLERMDLFAGAGDDTFDARFVSYQAALRLARFFGELGNDRITLAPSATTRFYIDGGPPARPTFPGDALFFVNAGQLILPPVLLGHGGSDGLYRFLNRMAVRFVSIESGAGGNLDIQPWHDVLPNAF